MEDNLIFIPRVTGTTHTALSLSLNLLLFDGFAISEVLMGICVKELFYYYDWRLKYFYLGY